MAKVMTVVAYQSVSDADALVAYGKLAGPAIAAAGGRVLARGMPLSVFEAGKMERTVVIEWDSQDIAEAVYSDPAYMQAVAELKGTAVRDIRIVAKVE